MPATGTRRTHKQVAVLAIICLTTLIGILVFAYSGILKKQVPPDDHEVSGGTHKIDKRALIATLEKKVRAIPAENIAANLDGYQRLLKLSAGNARYERKVAYYRARETAASRTEPTKIETKSTRREYIKVGFPDPRVLSAPETGAMIGRVDSGKLVEILDRQVIESGSLKITWYKIKYGDRSGWLSQLGTTGEEIVQVSDAAGTMSEQRTPTAGLNPWEKLAATMIDDYQGKIVAIERLDIEESHFSLYSGMHPEQVRQTCENIGYYIRNSTGESPVVVALVDGQPVARAHPAGTKYQASLLTR